VRVLELLTLVDELSLVWWRRRERGSEMPHRARPMTGLLVFMGINLVLVNTISPVYDFVCFHPYWERRVRYSPHISLQFLIAQ